MLHRLVRVSARCVKDVGIEVCNPSSGHELTQFQAYDETVGKTQVPSMEPM